MWLKKIDNLIGKVKQITQYLAFDENTCQIIIFKYVLLLSQRILKEFYTLGKYSLS